MLLTGGHIINWFMTEGRYYYFGRLIPFATVERQYYATIYPKIPVDFSCQNIQDLFENPAPVLDDRSMQTILRKYSIMIHKNNFFNEYEFKYMVCKKLGENFFKYNPSFDVWFPHHTSSTVTIIKPHFLNYPMTSTCSVKVKT